jgi:hypothetical protein
VLKDILFVVAEALHDEDYLDVGEAVIDGISRPRRREGSVSARQNAAKAGCVE